MKDNDLSYDVVVRRKRRRDRLVVRPQADPLGPSMA
jgi:hypothetical protein